MSKETETSHLNSEENIENDEQPNDKIVTTEEEIEAFLIVKAILRQKLSIERIHYRDAQSYFSIILDNNNRKPICRLYLAKRKFIVFFDKDKKENKIEIEKIDDIFNFSDNLMQIIENYENTGN